LLSTIVVGNGYNKSEIVSLLLNVITSDHEIYLKTNGKEWVHVFNLNENLVIEMVRHGEILARSIIDLSRLLNILANMDYFESDTITIHVMTAAMFIEFK